jgi:hypothetical protein
VLQDFVRTSRILTIRGGLAGKQILNADQVGDLTKILPREQYVAKIMGALNMPVTSLVSVLANTIRGLMNVLNAIIEQQGGAPDTAETATDESATGSAGDTAPEAATEEAATPEAAAPEEASASTEDAATPEDGASAEGSDEGSAEETTEGSAEGDTEAEPA